MMNKQRQAASPQKHQKPPPMHRFLRHFFFLPQWKPKMNEYGHLWQLPRCHPLEHRLVWSSWSLEAGPMDENHLKTVQTKSTKQHRRGRLGAYDDAQALSACSKSQHAAQITSHRRLTTWQQVAPVIFTSVLKLNMLNGSSFLAHITEIVRIIIHVSGGRNPLVLAL